MLALSESNSVVSISSRARPRVQGSTFATIQRTLHHEPHLRSFASHPRAFQGNSPTSGKRLQRADHSNQQYSILALTDSSGEVVERVAYQAYGRPTFTNAAGTTLSSSAKAIRYSYTGREWDASLELHHFRARWMSGVSGRFCSKDPLGLALDEFNLYCLNESNPFSFVDPSGLVCARPPFAACLLECVARKCTESGEQFASYKSDDMALLCNRM